VGGASGGGDWSVGGAGGSSCGPGLINGTALSLSAQGAFPPATVIPQYTRAGAPLAGTGGSSEAAFVAAWYFAGAPGLVVIEWDGPLLPSLPATRTTTATRTATPSTTATPSGLPTTGSASPMPTPAPTRTRSPTRTPTPSSPVCRGMANVRLLAGASGSAPPLSSRVDGTPGMYTAGTCAAGLRAFFPGSRLLYSLFLGATTPLGGVLTVTTCGLSANNTVLYVGTGCPAWDRPFGCVVGNDNAAAPACGSNALASTASVTASQLVYFVQLGGLNGEDVTAGVAWSYAAPAASRSASGTRSRSRSRSRSRTRSRSRSASASRSRKRK
jgi:hypothetical protein